MHGEYMLIVGGCSHPSTASLGIVFEIEEVRNLSWIIVRNWLWYRFLCQDPVARCESLFSPEILITDVKLEGCTSAAVSIPWVSTSIPAAT
jgi:hypothetical protein